MGILTLAEDRPTPKSVYNWRVYALAAIASCGSNMIGYTSAFIGTTITLTSFEREFGFDRMSSEHVSTIDENIVSFFIAGAFFAALGTYALGHFLGRKWSLVIASAVFTCTLDVSCPAWELVLLPISSLFTSLSSLRLPFEDVSLDYTNWVGRLAALSDFGSM